MDTSVSFGLTIKVGGVTVFDGGGGGRTIDLNELVGVGLPPLPEPDIEIPTYGSLTQGASPERHPRRITFGFGARYPGGRLQHQKHSGWDFGDFGEPVHAPADGIVDYSGNPPNDWGWDEIVTVISGDLVFRFGHLDHRLVKTGDRVYRGQELATIGYPEPGGGKTPHCHFDVSKVGGPVDHNPSFPSGVRAESLRKIYIDPATLNWAA